MQKYLKSCEHTVVTPKVHFRNKENGVETCIFFLVVFTAYADKDNGNFIKIYSIFISGWGYRDICTILILSYLQQLCPPMLYSTVLSSHSTGGWDFSTLLILYSSSIKFSIIIIFIAIYAVNQIQQKLVLYTICKLCDFRNFVIAI